MTKPRALEGTDKGFGAFAVHDPCVAHDPACVDGHTVSVMELYEASMSSSTAEPVPTPASSSGQGATPVARTDRVWHRSFFVEEDLIGS